MKDDAKPAVSDTVRAVVVPAHVWEQVTDVVRQIALSRVGCAGTSGPVYCPELFRKVRIDSIMEHIEKVRHNEKVRV
jgi:hypothetical protein